jgi:hypothetical protein
MKSQVMPSWTPLSAWISSALLGSYMKRPVSGLRPSLANTLMWERLNLRSSDCSVCDLAEVTPDEPEVSL